jgi:hypothetical protein
MNIKNLPDYPALLKLADALWKKHSHFRGAAVMVGAGFTRSAVEISASGKKPPIWPDLAKRLSDELGGSKESDPLKLAEEYQAFHGKQALRDLLKKEIHDEAWQPGVLYETLLTLPWNEVLTTNWDRLLERASEQIHSPLYSVVHHQEDLSSAISPRIVKLHGTINITEDLIFSQEDYRKYPYDYAAYVNVTRQVFIENELCLIGFSGEDPNFLKWAGWVRDQLSSHSRRIYLVGALGLSASRRKYLESINIAPIDLKPLVAEHDNQDAMHQSALKQFFVELKNLEPKKPWDWKPTQIGLRTGSSEDFDRRLKDGAYQARLLEEQLPVLQADRQAYPGWLICPGSIRSLLNQQIADPWPNLKNLALMAVDKRVQLLYEIAWRDRVTLDVVNPALVPEMLAVCDPAKPNALTKQQQLEIALVLLQSTRWLSDEECEGVALKTTEILQNNFKHWPDSANELVYHKAQVTRDELDYAKLNQLVVEIEASTPIWQMRKASLLVELGQFETGRELIEKAFSELQRQYRHERDSIQIFSQLAWAHFLMWCIERVDNKKPYQKFPNTYKDARCDPSDYLEAIEEKINKAIGKQDQQIIEPTFTPGTYKDHSKTITFGGESSPILLLDGLVRTVGIPQRVGHNINMEIAGKTTAAIASLKNLEDYRYSLAIRAATSEDHPAIKKVFAPIATACMSQASVDRLLDQCLQAIQYWRIELGKPASQFAALERLRVFTEVLARLSTRSSTDRSIEIFRFAVSLGKDSNFRHHRLITPIEHLIDNSLRNIPKALQKNILLDALYFPLGTEVGLTNFPRWPNPEIHHPGDRPDSKELDRRIDEIIEQLSPNQETNAVALQRLLPLVKNGFLSESESGKIASKIWGGNLDLGNIPVTGLFSFDLIQLPSTDPLAVRKTIASSLFENFSIETTDRHQLIDIANVARNEIINLKPNENQATIIFNQLVEWRKTRIDHPFMGWDSKIIKSNEIGQALAYAIVESLPTTELTIENFESLHKFMSDCEEPTVLRAMPYFAVVNSDVSHKVENLILQALQKRESNYNAYAGYAILQWSEIGESLSVQRLIKRLIYLICSGRTRGLSNLLWVASELVKKNKLTSEELKDLTESLPIIYDSTNYAAVNEMSPWDVVDAPIVRKACVELVSTILKSIAKPTRELEVLIESAKSDPFPEVRFAAAS